MAGAGLIFGSSIGALSGLLGNSSSKAAWDAAKKANIQTWANAAQAISAVNIQRGIARQQTAQQLFDQSKAASSALGMLSVGTASSGTVGASVQAVASDIQRQSAQAAAQTEANFQITDVNLNSSIRDIVNAAGSSMQYAAKPSSGLSSVFGGAMQGLFNTAGTQGTADLISGAWGSVSGMLPSWQSTTSTAKKAFTGSFSF